MVDFCPTLQWSRAWVKTTWIGGFHIGCPSWSVKWASDFGKDHSHRKWGYARDLGRLKCSQRRISWNTQRSHLIPPFIPKLPSSNLKSQKLPSLRCTKKKCCIASFFFRAIRGALLICPQPKSALGSRGFHCGWLGVYCRGTCRGNAVLNAHTRQSIRVKNVWQYWCSTKLHNIHTYKKG